MDINQKLPPYEPIEIVLKTRGEAQAFFSIIDKVEVYRHNHDSRFTISQDEAAVLVRLSNSHSDGNVTS